MDLSVKRKVISWSILGLMVFFLIEIWTLFRTHTRDKSDFETRTFEKYKNIVVGFVLFLCFILLQTRCSLSFHSIKSAVWSGLRGRLPDIHLQVLPFYRLKMSSVNETVSLVLHVCSSKTLTHIRKADIWNQWTSGYETLSEILRLIPDILTVTKAEPSMCVCVCVCSCHIHTSRTDRVLCGYVTSPFITPHGQLSAEGKMEVVSWGPAGGFSYH